MSPACQKILEKNVAGIYDDEDWAYGDGYYASNWPDIDEDADVGVIGMPYSVRLPPARVFSCVKCRYGPSIGAVPRAKTWSCHKDSGVLSVRQLDLASLHHLRSDLLLAHADGQ